MDKFIVMEFAWYEWDAVGGAFDSFADAQEFVRERRDAAFETAFDQWEFAANFDEDQNVTVRGDVMWAWQIATIWVPAFKE